MKTFEIFESMQVISERKLYTAATALCESMHKMIEDGDIEWEPQPEFKGKKGTATDTGPGIQARKAGEQKQKMARFGEQWDKLKKAYMQMRSRGDIEGAAKMYAQLERLHAAASAKGASGLELPPAPEEERRHRFA